MSRRWAGQALDFLASGEPAAMTTLAAVHGSAPREAGARMIIGRDAILGTVGGGNLEHLLVGQGRKLIGQTAVRFAQQDYPLGPMLAQCCGGRVRVLIEQLDTAARPWLAAADAAEQGGQPYTLEGSIKGGQVARVVRPGWEAGQSAAVELFSADGAPAGRAGAWVRIIERIAPIVTPLYLFGAGHVGRAIAHVMAGLPFRLAWMDIRPEMAGNVAGASVTVRSDLTEAALEAPAGACFLVMTHSHDLDYQLVRAILRRRDALYCGLIGSETKRARFIARLATEGVGVAELTCPIGAGLSRSKEPASIAIAVAAELLALLETLSSSADRRP